MQNNTYENYNGGTNGDVFDFGKLMYVIQQTADIAQKNAIATNSMIDDVSIMKITVGNISTQINGIDGVVTNLNDRMTNIEQAEEITTEQNENITEAIKRRIVEIIGTDPYEKAKYFRGFSFKLYSDAKRNGGMGSKASRTRKGNYQRTLNYIEAWNPVGGALKLKRDIDANAVARLKARETGHID